ncbi:YajQ family cyclic di-GMP-binding protein [Acidipila sp. EB88]|uniref:YajQ family cyclic di-GMP-binding protein n=1 Tax=Acidipila sp. EB88 TaxID=2305226 RepID=UPI000F5D84F4|nr:YajQ family cyclic di-GMP-binding protein [Acidipila sp. EB88]RRA47381.1 YajQ family cyclic di-GMP-binding protein [Acidipila sp. EB88]
MAADNSFDIVSKVELQEVKNAIDQATKEVNARFDLKDSKSSIKLDGDEKGLELASQDSYKLEAVTQILEQKLIKRGISIKSLEFGKVEAASGSSVRQKVTLKQGIAIEKAKEIVRIVKDSKTKVQATIQGETVRITGKDRDTLQETIALLKKQDLGIDMQFTNFRSN